MVTVKLCAGCPELGVRLAIEAGGFTINVAVFALENLTPDAVLPETETRYLVGIWTGLPGTI